MIQNTLIKFALAFFIIFTVTACHEEKDGQRAVDAFLKDMSPELARKIDKIGQEISLTEKKIDKLSELKRKHPNYAGKIETARRQWEVLQEKLRQSLKDIREVVESSYVTYELDRIQGGNQFNKISGKLLSSVDEVLASAGTTKEAIEQALNEVEDEPLPLLGEVNENSSDAPEPPVERITFETKAEPEIVEPPTVYVRFLFCRHNLDVYVSVQIIYQFFSR
jgi:Zn-dependent M32 family carboxypeptidase